MKQTKLEKAEALRELSRQYAMGNDPSIVKKPDELTCEFLAGQLRRLRKVGGKGAKRLRLEAMGMTYREYIHSSGWKAFRQNYLDTQTTDCEVHGCLNEGLILHHRNYHRLGNELPDDVALVCVTCHDRIHDIARRKH